MDALRPDRTDLRFEELDRELGRLIDRVRELEWRAVGHARPRRGDRHHGRDDRRRGAD